MFITPTQSQNHTKVHVVIFTFWKSLSCLLSVLSQTLSLYFPHYSKLEKNRGNFTYFHVLEAEVAEAELAGRWDCWGWLGWAGPEDSAGPGGCAAEPWGSAFLSRVLKRGCWVLQWETKEANEVRQAFDKGQEVARDGSSASSHDSRLWFLQFLLGFKITA